MITNENNSFDDAAQSAGADENLTQDIPVADAQPMLAAIHDAPAPKRRWRAPAIAAAILVPMLAVGGGVAAAAHKTIELDYDGVSQELTTWSGSVAGFLEDHGVVLGAHDEVTPALDEKLQEGGTVVIRVAQEVSLDIDGKTTTMWTVADSAHELMNTLADSGRDGSIVASSRSIADGRDPLDLPLVEDGEVLLAVDGGEETREFTGEVTVAEALEEFGIELGETDQVTIEAGPSGEVLLKVTRIEYSERVETEEIPFETETQKTDSLYKDQSKVSQAGVVGERTFTYRVKTVDGEEVDVTELSNEVTTEPVTKIIQQGTKTRPVVTTTTSSSSSSSSSGSSSTVSGDVWARLAQCESGGNPSIVSASGKYHGLYQFSVATWQAVGGTGLPSQASAAEQTKRAQILQARSGWGQWPHCSAKLGLR